VPLEEEQLLVSPKKGTIDDIVDEVKSEIEAYTLGQVCIT